MPWILIGALAVLTISVIALPASVARRFLPASIGAEDFSGSLWHGSAGRITFKGRNLGAVEWHLHPWPLLRLALAADLHWVKTGFEADGAVVVTSHGVTLQNLQGSGPIEDLRDLGVDDGWRGAANFTVGDLEAVYADPAGGGFPTITSAVGELRVSNLASPQVADGADLGGYVLHLANAAVPPGGPVTADLTDTGGPLDVQADIQLSLGGRTGMLTGTVRARVAEPPALMRQLDDLAQLHARDAQGRIPVDLEFTF